MLTEKHLRENPLLIKAFMGLPVEVFWQLVADIEAKLPGYELNRLDRKDHQRAVGGGREFDLPLVIRVALVLTYLRLHIPQLAVVCLYQDATQPDVLPELRRLLPLLKQVLPCPEVWEIVEEGAELTEAELLELAQWVDGRVLIDATEQQVCRPAQSNEERKKFFSGKKKQFTRKTQFAADSEHHIEAISVRAPGAKSDLKLSFYTRRYFFLNYLYNRLNAEKRWKFSSFNLLSGSSCRRHNFVKLAGYTLNLGMTGSVGEMAVTKKSDLPSFGLMLSGPNRYAKIEARRSVDL